MRATIGDRLWRVSGKRHVDVDLVIVCGESAEWGVPVEFEALVEYPEWREWVHESDLFDDLDEANRVAVLRALRGHAPSMI